MIVDFCVVERPARAWLGSVCGNHPVESDDAGDSRLLGKSVLVCLPVVVADRVEASHFRNDFDVIVLVQVERLLDKTLFTILMMDAYTVVEGNLSSKTEGDEPCQGQKRCEALTLHFES